MSFVIANNVNTTLAAAASSSSTTLTLASSTNLPTLGSGQVMPLTLNDAATGAVYEVVYVTAITGPTLTVVRAQEGTGAQNWSIGDYALCAYTKGVLGATAQQSQVQAAQFTNAADSGAANAYVLALSPAPTALTPGMIVAIDSLIASNTGASTLNVNAIGALPIQLPGGDALQGGELVATYGAVFRLNHAGTAWILLNSTGLDRQLGGAGQSWQDVTASRALGTTYTNNTGRPIQVIVSANSSTPSALMTATLGGVSIEGPAQGTSGINASMSFVIPNGVTYSVSMVGSTTLAAWAELR